MNDINFVRASKQKKDDKEVEKLVNIVYHDDRYFIHEPKNSNEKEENIIDNHLWFIMKFMPKKRYEVKLGDVIRFGRIPFKVVRLVIDTLLEKEQR